MTKQVVIDGRSYIPKLDLTRLHVQLIDALDLHNDVALQECVIVARGLRSDLRAARERIEQLEREVAELKNLESMRLDAVREAAQAPLLRAELSESRARLAAYFAAVEAYRQKRDEETRAALWREHESFARSCLFAAAHPAPPEAKGEAADAIRKAAEGTVKLVLNNREAYVRAWVAETGLHPLECELVEKREPDGATILTVRKREGAKGDKTMPGGEAGTEIGCNVSAGAGSTPDSAHPVASAGNVTNATGPASSRAPTEDDHLARARREYDGGFLLEAVGDILAHLEQQRAPAPSKAAAVKPSEASPLPWRVHGGVGIVDARGVDVAQVELGRSEKQAEQDAAFIVHLANRWHAEQGGEGQCDPARHGKFVEPLSDGVMACSFCRRPLIGEGAS